MLARLCHSGHPAKEGTGQKGGFREHIPHGPLAPRSLGSYAKPCRDVLLVQRISFVYADYLQMALAQEADRRQTVCSVKVGRFIGSDSAAFEVPEHWIQTGPGSLSPLSLPRPTKETRQKDTLRLPQALAQLRIQPPALPSQEPRAHFSGEGGSSHLLRPGGTWSGLAPEFAYLNIMNGCSPG